MSVKKTERFGFVVDTSALVYTYVDAWCAYITGWLDESASCSEAQEFKKQYIAEFGEPLQMVIPYHYNVEDGNTLYSGVLETPGYNISYYTNPVSIFKNTEYMLSTILGAMQVEYKRKLAYYDKLIQKGKTHIVQYKEEYIAEYADVLKKVETDPSTVYTNLQGSMIVYFETKPTIAMLHRLKERTETYAKQNGLDIVGYRLITEVQTIDSEDI